MNQTDILIIGGGLVGATFALMAARDPQLSITLVETFAPPGNEGPAPVFRPSFDGRSTALSRTTSRAFSRLGIWDEVRQFAEAIEHIHVSEQGRFGMVRLHAEEEAVDAFGFVIENAWLGRVLMQAIARAPNIRFMAPARVTQLQREPDAVQVTVRMNDEESVLRARLVVAADGAESQTRESLGITCEEFDYGQAAIVTNVETNLPHGHVAYERFGKEGVLAVLPRMDNRRAVIWTVPLAQAPEFRVMDEKIFLSRLQSAFGNRAGRFEKVGERHVYPLKRVIAHAQVMPRIVVLGNAAHFLHPVAGQGFNLCVRDCEELANRVLSAKASGADIGDYSLLREYEAVRLRDQDAITHFSDKLVRIFSVNNAALSHLRSIGMLLFDVTPGSKSALARMTMGVAG